MKRLNVLILGGFIIVSSLAAQSSKTTFIPSKHGWNFSNRFDYHVVVRLLGKDHQMKKSIGNGLCGGMCFGAIDYYKKKRAIPNLSSTPKVGESLTTYITNRQQTSMHGIKVPIKLADWIKRPDRAHPPFGRHSVGSYTKKEIDKLKQLIRAGKPTTIVLVRGRKIFKDAPNAHQVVAYRYTEDTKKKLITFWVYDPNHPNNDNVIVRVQKGFKKNKIEVTARYKSRISNKWRAISRYKERGFFINDYKKK